MEENLIGCCIIKAAIAIHRETGPGLFESVYEIILAHHLKKSGLNVERQVAVPIQFKGISFDQGFRADLIVENKVIVELKSVEKLNNAHKKQILTYLRLSNMRLGYILNFNETLMKNGIHRSVNQLR